MNILMALSQKELTGAESYACTLGDQLTQRGHIVRFVSDTLTLTPHGRCYRLAFNKRSLLRRLWHIVYLIWLLRREKIQLVHAHSRAARWSCRIACFLLRIPLVTTIHGRQPIHSSSQQRPMLGDAVIAVCEALAEHMRTDFLKSRAPVYTIPNGVDCRVFYPSAQDTASSQQVIGIAGRLTGPKGDLCYLLLKEVLDLNQHQVHIASASPIPQRFKTFNTVQFHTCVEDIRAFYSDCDVIIGAGRVAIEALLCGKPTFAIGEACALGWVTGDNFEQAMACNFGDIGPKILDFETQTLINALDTDPKIYTPSPALQEKVKAIYNTITVADQIESVYQSTWVHYHKREIPVLMYHRFVQTKNEGGQHGTWITVKRFEAHLKWLKKNNYETLTFADLHQQGLFSRLSQGKRFVMITVDDGYRDNLTLLVPLLEKYKYKAVLFAVTRTSYNRWDIEGKAQPEMRLPLLNTTELQKVIASGCIELGGHTCSHPELSKLTKQEQIQEIKHNKQDLEALTQQQLLAFAYPFGDYDVKTQNIVQSLGYHYAVATDSGPLALHEDRFAIRRIAIFPSTTLARFRRKIRGNYAFRKAQRSL